MQRKILVADDDASIRSSLKKVLEHEGYEVAVAADGVEAQIQLKNQPADLLILDLDMPRRDGWDVMDDVKLLNPPIPVIVLTGMFDQLASFEFEGIYALMGKPVDAQSLLLKIERFLAGCDRAVLAGPHPSGEPHVAVDPLQPQGAVACSITNETLMRGRRS